MDHPQVVAVAPASPAARAGLLTGDEILAWMRVANDVRLVLGVRLDITEGYRTPGPDDPEAPMYALYDLLTWLVATIVETVPV